MGSLHVTLPNRQQLITVLYSSSFLLFVRVKKLKAAEICKYFIVTLFYFTLGEGGGCLKIDFFKITLEI